MSANAMYKLTYGLFVVTSFLDGKDNGCITNTAIQVTTDPNRIAFAVNKLNYTHDMLMESKVFNISIISEAADFELFMRFGFQSGREVNKFQGYGKIGLGSNGITYIKDGTNASSQADEDDDELYKAVRVAILDADGGAGVEVAAEDGCEDITTVRRAHFLRRFFVRALTAILVVAGIIAVLRYF